MSNDDGILAPGLAAMQGELTKLGEVTVVAPASIQTAAAHSITLRGPLAVRQVHVQDQFVGYSVEGRPADCVKVAVSELLDELPDLVVSGINDGANVSINVLYSGTVAAAAEGALLGCPAVAVSLRQGRERDFNRAAKIALSIIKELLDVGLSAGELINVNIPDLTEGDPRGIRLVPQATRTLEERFVRHLAPDGCDYYWLTPGQFKHSSDDAHSDLDAIDDRYVAVTPLHFDLTHYQQLKELQQHHWKLGFD
ncbi:MAG: 5'/3'-nucleotidase SurE [Planctomycetota bacterium]